MTDKDQFFRKIANASNCAQLVYSGKIDPNIFYSKRRNSIAMAKRVCENCFIKTDCLEWAVENPKKSKGGVWGGMTTRERNRAKKNDNLNF